MLRIVGFLPITEAENLRVLMLHIFQTVVFDFESFPALNIHKVTRLPTEAMGLKLMEQELY